MVADTQQSSAHAAHFNSAVYTRRRRTASPPRPPRRRRTASPPRPPRRRRTASPPRPPRRRRAKRPPPRCPLRLCQRPRTGVGTRWRTSGTTGNRKRPLTAPTELAVLLQPPTLGTGRPRRPPGRRRSPQIPGGRRRRLGPGPARGRTSRPGPV